MGKAHSGLRYMLMIQSGYSNDKAWLNMQNMGGSGPIVGAVLRELVACEWGRAVTPRIAAGIVEGRVSVENMGFLTQVLEAATAKGILGTQQVSMIMNFVTGCKLDAEPGPPRPLLRFSLLALL